MLSSTLLSTLTALSLTTLSTALPAPTYQTNEFTLTLDAAHILPLPLTALQSPTVGNLHLVFSRPSAYTGTPAYLNNTFLSFNYSGTYPGIYRAHFNSDDVGEGDKMAVTAVFGDGEGTGTEGFGQGPDGTLTPPGSGAGSFYACNSTIEVEGKEEAVLGLFWGARVEGVDASGGEGADDGCVVARLVQEFADA